MNKYQEALDYFCAHCVEYKEKRNILQELVDKATPKKPNMDIFNVWCPNCNFALGIDFTVFGMKEFLGTRFCPNCGQALKWKEEDGDAK